MARKKKPASTSPTEDSRETLARKIWLAGLGAYGKGVEEAQDRLEQLDRAGQDAQRAFEELVKKGQRIERSTRSQLADARDRIDPGSVRERLHEARERISESVADRLQGAAGGTRSVEDMIDRVRRRVGADDPVSRRIDALSRDVADLARAMTALAGMRFGAGSEDEAATPESPSTGSKRPVRSTAASRKRPSKKQPAKKAPVARKAAAKKKSAPNKTAAKKPAARTKRG